MPTRRKSIKLYAHERKLLVKLYLRRRIPIDQYEKRPRDCASFESEWQELSKRDDTWGDLFHYMRSQRKRGLWVRLDGAHKSGPPLPEMTADEVEALVAIYEVNVVDAGSDTLGYDEDIPKLLVREMRALTGRTFSAHQLVAKLTALRKRGLLPKVSEQSQSDDMGSEDNLEAAS